MSKDSELYLCNYLEHILTAIERINHYTDEVSEIVFLQSEMVQDAVIRNIETISEASRHIDRHYPYFFCRTPRSPLERSLLDA